MVIASKRRSVFQACGMTKVHHVGALDVYALQGVKDGALV